MVRRSTFNFLMLTKIFYVTCRILLQAGSILQRFHGLSDWGKHSTSWFRQLSSETSWWKDRIWEFRWISISTPVLTDVGKPCQGFFPVFESCFWPKSRRGSTASFSASSVCISLPFTSNGLMKQINLMYILWEKNKFLFYCFLQLIEHDLFQNMRRKLECPSTAAVIWWNGNSFHVLPCQDICASDLET